MRSERPTLPPSADIDEVKSQRFLREWRAAESTPRYGSRVIEACAIAKRINSEE